MSEKPINPLRRRMIEDMTVRNFVEKTRNDYIRHVKTSTAFPGRSPDTATAEDSRRFQLHQTETGVRPPAINGSPPEPGPGPVRPKPKSAKASGHNLDCQSGLRSSRFRARWRLELGQWPEALALQGLPTHLQGADGTPLPSCIGATPGLPMARRSPTASVLGAAKRCCIALDTSFRRRHRLLKVTKDAKAKVSKVLSRLTRRSSASRPRAPGGLSGGHPNARQSCRQAGRIS
jgi:hypothetical protein